MLIFLNFLAFLIIGVILIMKGRSKKWEEYDKRKYIAFQKTVGTLSFFSSIAKWNIWALKYRKSLYTILGIFVIIGAIIILILSIV